MERRTSRILKQNVRTRAQRNPGDDSEYGGNMQLSDFAIPAGLGALALLVFGGPALGTIASSLGFVLLITAGAGATGVIDRISSALGVSPVTAAGGLIFTIYGVLLIPAFLKFGFFAFGVLLVYNILSGLLGGIEGINGGSVDIDPRDVTIDIEAETLDD